MLRDYPFNKCSTSSHIKFGSEGKTRAVVALSSFEAYFGGFDQVDKTVNFSLGWRGKKSFSLDPI